MFVIFFSPCLVSDFLGLHYVHDILGPHYVHNQMLKFGTPLECLSSLIPNLLFMFVIFIFFVVFVICVANVVAFFITSQIQALHNPIHYDFMTFKF